MFLAEGAGGSLLCNYVCRSRGPGNSGPGNSLDIYPLTSMVMSLDRHLAVHIGNRIAESRNLSVAEGVQMHNRSVPQLAPCLLKVSSATESLLVSALGKSVSL